MSFAPSIEQRQAAVAEKFRTEFFDSAIQTSVKAMTLPAVTKEVSEILANFSVQDIYHDAANERLQRSREKTSSHAVVGQTGDSGEMQWIEKLLAVTGGPLEAVHRR